MATAASASPNPATGTTTALSVLGADDGAEINLTYTWATTGSPPAAVTFSPNSTNDAKTTVATFTKAGSYSFLVTITDAIGLSVTSSVSVTVNQTLTSVTVSPASVTLNEQQSQQFAATARDQFGTALSSQPAFTWAKASGVGSISASGLYTAPASTGAATVTAATGAVSGGASITVTNAAPTVATAASASPNPASGTSTGLSVLGADDGGQANLTYTWATTGSPPALVTFSVNGTNAGKSTIATFTKAGAYSLRVTITDAGGLSVISSISVTVSQTLTSIIVSPGSVTLYEQQSQQFAATGYDQFGAVLVSQPPFTWAKASGVGGISASGLYTAPAGTGAATITAASGAVSGGASITVNNATPTVATAASASPSPATGTTTGLSVLGADDGGQANLTYTWATTGSPPALVTFSVNGTNAARNATATFTAAGAYNFQVTITDAGGLSVTSSISVTVNQTLTSITVSPG
ncbi:MAG: Ig-like domain-containing protein, partial [Planctomycetota bacterium]|nr:Ig-like domain-containing protein [Planctomycetota bacterium]